MDLFNKRLERKAQKLQEQNERLLATIAEYEKKEQLLDAQLKHYDELTHNMDVIIAERKRELESLKVLRGKYNDLVKEAKIYLSQIKKTNKEIQK